MLNLTTNEKLAIIGIGAILFAPKILGAITKQTSAAIVNAAGGAVTGAVIGAGEQVGIPQTDIDKCRADLIAGNTWDASFSCPASDFLKYLYDGSIPGGGVSGLGETNTKWITPVILLGAAYFIAKG